MPQNVRDIITQAATAHGVNPDTMLTIARIESNFDPNAHNASGAGGLFQLMPATATEQGVDDPYDATANAEAAARITATNTAALTRTLGRAPTTGELYLAHQQGLSGARAILSHPDLPAVDALATAYGGSTNRARQAIVQNGGDPNAPASQFAQLWTGRADAAQGLLPPSNVPEVASAYADTRAPGGAAEDAIAQMLHPTASQTAFGTSQPATTTVPRSTMDAGTALAFDPVMGGQTALPQFDYGFDPATGLIRPFDEAASSGYNVLTPAQRNALSALPPTPVAPTPATMSTALGTSRLAPEVAPTPTAIPAGQQPSGHVNNRTGQQYTNDQWVEVSANRDHTNSSIATTGKAVEDPLLTRIIANTALPIAQQAVGDATTAAGNWFNNTGLTKLFNDVKNAPPATATTPKTSLPGTPSTNFDTQLPPDAEAEFQKWKQTYAPNDSGNDYDLRGAFAAGVTPSANGHWPDTFKKPSEPTFSNQSQYAKYAPTMAGSWDGDTYIPPALSLEARDERNAQMSNMNGDPAYTAYVEANKNNVTSNLGPAYNPTTEAQRLALLGTGLAAPATIPLSYSVANNPMQSQAPIQPAQTGQSFMDSVYQFLQQPHDDRLAAEAAAATQAKSSATTPSSTTVSGKSQASLPQGMVPAFQPPAPQTKSPSAMATPSSQPSYNPANFLPGADLESLNATIPTSAVPKYITINKSVQVPMDQPIAASSGVHWDDKAMNYVDDTIGAAPTPQYKTVVKKVQVLNPDYVTPPVASPNATGGLPTLHEVNGQLVDASGKVYGAAPGTVQNWFNGTPIVRASNAVGGLLGGLFAAPALTPATPAQLATLANSQYGQPVLGVAANGGVVTQGANGLLNSNTQNSAYWQMATGQSNGGGSSSSSTDSLSSRG